MKKIITPILACSLLTVHAQEIAGYNFNEFPAAQTSPSKAKSPDYADSPSMKKNKTKIQKRYTGAANFAGTYQVLTWGCGTGCLTGVLVDTRNGKIHKLPELGANNCGRASEHAKDDRLIIKKTSRLLLSANCPIREGDRPATVSYRAFAWDEKSKTFIPQLEGEK